MCCVSFWALVMLLNTVSSSPIHVVSTDWVSSFLTTEWWSWCVSRFPYPASAGLCLSWSHYSNFERNFLFNLLVSIPRDRPSNSIARSYGSFIFNYWRNHVLFSINGNTNGAAMLDLVAQTCSLPQGHSLPVFLWRQGGEEKSFDPYSSLNLVLIFRVYFFIYFLTFIFLIYFWTKEVIKNIKKKEKN